jgi:hypothetical protein
MEKGGPTNRFEKFRENFPWRYAEESPSFRAFIVASLDLGALPRDITVLIADFAPQFNAAPPNQRGVEYYLGPFKEDVEVPEIVTHLKTLGLERDAYIAEYMRIYEHLRTTNPGRLWRFARDARALALYFLVEKSASPQLLARALSRHFDVAVPDHAVKNALLHTARSLEAKRKLSHDEAFAQARDTVIEQLAKGLGETERERGRAKGAKMEPILTIGRYAPLDSWRNDELSVLIINAIRQRIKVDKTCCAIAAQVIDRIRHKAIHVNTIDQFLRSVRKDNGFLIQRAVRNAPVQLQQLAQEIAEAAVAAHEDAIMPEIRDVVYGQFEYEATRTTTMLIERRMRDTAATRAEAAYAAQMDEPFAEAEPDEPAFESVVEPSLEASEWNEEAAIRKLNMLERQIGWLTKALAYDIPPSESDPSWDKNRERLEFEVRSLQNGMHNVLEHMTSEPEWYPPRSECAILEKAIAEAFDMLPYSVRRFPPEDAFLEGRRLQREQELLRAKIERRRAEEARQRETQLLVPKPEKPKVSETPEYRSPLDEPDIILALAYMRAEGTYRNNEAAIMRELFPEKAIYMNAFSLAELAFKAFKNLPDLYVHQQKKQGVVVDKETIKRIEEIAAALPPTPKLPTKRVENTPQTPEARARAIVHAFHPDGIITRRSFPHVTLQQFVSKRPVEEGSTEIRTLQGAHIQLLVPTQISLRISGQMTPEGYKERADVNELFKILKENVHAMNRNRPSLFDPLVENGYDIVNVVIREHLRDSKLRVEHVTALSPRAREKPKK